MNEWLDIAMRYHGKVLTARVQQETLDKVVDNRQFVINLCGDLFDGLEAAIEQGVIAEGKKND